MTPSLFLHLMLYGVDSELKSLRQISSRAKSEHTLHVSKQGLDERFSQASVDFVKTLISQTLASQISSTLAPNELQLFNTVRIKDSTTFGLHESLSEHFEGYGKGGGPSSKAGVSIQFEFDLKSNRVIDLDINSAVTNDAKDAVSKKHDICKADLIIRDLGYYSDKVIQEIVEKEAFFISRLYTNTIVRADTQNETRLDFEKMYRHMIQTQISRMEMNVFVGSKKRPVRLIIELMPDEVYEKRIRRRKKEINKPGTDITDEFRIRSRFNLFVCNIPADKCTAETISKLYRTRWQIELVFKIWKSILHIDKFRKMKIERFLTSIYLKLLWILINWQVISSCRNYFFNEKQKLLSISKSFQMTNEIKHHFREEILSNNVEKINGIIIKIILTLEDNHWSEKRKNRCNFEEIINLLFCNTTN